MQNTPFRLGPLALTNTYTTNICNPGTITGGTNGGSGNLYILIKKIRILDKSGAGGTFRLYLGATGANTAGTEIMGNNTTVAANSYVEEFFPNLILKTTDFLVGGASAGTTLTLIAEGEIGVAI